ncbi:MAG: glycogen synthase [Lentisphaerae bacterium]|nr:glycogen synthase [Lentisphaerota bacterium]
MNTPENKPEKKEQPDASPRQRVPNTLLFEIAWEVCQQLGGIYTVIRSKIPAMIERWGHRYCLIGPYNPATAAVEFEEAVPPDSLRPALEQMKEKGYDIHFGHWLVTGRPQVILLNHFSVYSRLGEIKYHLWNNHHIGTPGDDDEVNRVIAFGFLVAEFFRVLARTGSPALPVIAHFHEWMGASAIPDLRRDRLPVNIVFTTHATLLGRHLAMADPWFYDHLPFVNWETDARRFAIDSRVRLERAAAHGAHIFTTVSDVTALECRHLLGRPVDKILPNGLNIERFSALHEAENLHKIHKDRIHQFVMGHFFPSYSFNLDRTLYFFTSGRYEYRNKGFDLTLEALARLNYLLKEMRTDITIVMFIVSMRPFKSINADVLHNMAVMEEMRRTCMAIKDKLGDRLFQAVARGAIPDLNEQVDEYWRMRLRRTMMAWRTQRLPYIVTHDMWDNNDEVLKKLRACNLLNYASDPVKIVYHADFITPTNALFGMDYDQFVRGCHMGLFPSYYEPWGYTPLECVARGIPAVTSDLAGFGNYVLNEFPDCDKSGLYVIGRKDRPDDLAAGELAQKMFEFTRLTLRDRISMRYRAQGIAEHFDWRQLARHYTETHQLAMQRGERER